MTYSRLITLILFISLFTCNSVDKKTASYSIIPKPIQQIFSDGTFVLNNNTSIIHDDSFKIPADYLKLLIEEFE